MITIDDRIKQAGDMNRLNVDQLITLASQNFNKPKAAPPNSGSQAAGEVKKNMRPVKTTQSNQPDKPMQTVQPVQQVQTMQQMQPVQKEANAIEAVLANLNNDSLVQGFILSEILGKPKAKMQRGINRWSSRF